MKEYSTYEVVNVDALYNVINELLKFIATSIREIQAHNVRKEDITISMPNHLVGIIEHEFERRAMHNGYIAAANIKRVHNRYKSLNDQRHADVGIEIFGVMVFDNHYRNEIVVSYNRAVYYRKPQTVKILDLEKFIQ